jgi:hypothetical protein
MKKAMTCLAVFGFMIALVNPAAANHSNFHRSIVGADAVLTPGSPSTPLPDASISLTDTATNGYCAASYAQFRNGSTTWGAFLVGTNCTATPAVFSIGQSGATQVRHQVCNSGLNCGAWSGWINIS